MPLEPQSSAWDTRRADKGRQLARIAPFTSGKGLSSDKIRMPFTTLLREAWHTLVPESGGAHGPLPPALVALTVVAGLVDAFSFLLLDHVFVASMTGNVVFVALSLAGIPGFSVATSGLSLAAFVVGGIVAGRLGRLVGPHRGRQLLALCGTQAVLLLAAFVAAELLDRPYTRANSAVLIGLTALGMGVQNGLVRRLGVPELTTAVLTATISGMATNGWLGGGSDGRVGRRLLSVLALASGVLVGGLITRFAAAPLVLLLAALIVVVVTATAVRLARSRRPWTVSHASPPALGRRA